MMYEFPNDIDRDFTSTTKKASRTPSFIFTTPSEKVSSVCFSDDNGVAIVRLATATSSPSSV